MKKTILIIIAISGATGVIGQESKNSPIEPGKSLTVAEANALNGTAQPVMKNGRTYSQWVAEEKAKRVIVPGKANGSTQADVVGIKASDARPAPSRVETTAPAGDQKDNKIPVPAVTDKAIVANSSAPAKAQPEVPAQLRLPEAREWTGRAVTGEKSTLPAAEVTMPKSDPGQSLTGENTEKASPAAPRATEKPASRSGKSN